MDFFLRHLPNFGHGRKKILLDEAAEKNQILMFEHDAYTEYCTVVAQYKKHKVDKTMTFEEILN